MTAEPLSREAVWARRAAAEQVARLRYARLARVLATHDPGSPFIADLNTASEDEARHGGLCWSQAGALGWSRPAAKVSDHPRPVFGVSTLPNLIFEIVMNNCVGESLNAVLLQFELDAAADDRERRLTRELLRDELRHATLGWRFLAEMANRYDVSFLEAPLLAACAHPFSDADEPSGALIPTEERRSLMERGFRQFITPGLGRFGIRLEWEATQAMSHRQ